MRSEYKDARDALTSAQRRRARALLRSGAASKWEQAVALAQAERPDTSDDIEWQLVRSLARQRGLRRVLA